MSAPANSFQTPPTVPWYKKAHCFGFFPPLCVPLYQYNSPAVPLFLVQCTNCPCTTIHKLIAYFCAALEIAAGCSRLPRHELRMTIKL